MTKNIPLPSGGIDADPASEWLTVRDVARRLQRSRSSVWADVKRGFLPPPRYVGGRRAPRWLAGEVDAAMMPRAPAEPRRSRRVG